MTFSKMEASSFNSLSFHFFRSWFSSFIDWSFWAGMIKV